MDTHWHGDWMRFSSKKISKNRKEYYEKNKEHILQKRKVKIKCDVCNIMIRKDYFYKHQETKKHIDNIAKNA
jgi:hypothetical protein